MHSTRIVNNQFNSKQTIQILNNVLRALDFQTFLEKYENVVFIIINPRNSINVFKSNYQIIKKNIMNIN